MDDSQRIEEIKNFLNLSARALASEIGLGSPQIFYDIKADKCGISKHLASKIQERYVSLNLSWVLTGEGEMLKKSVNTNLTQSRDPRDIEVIELQSKQIALLEENVMSLKDNITSLKDNVTSLKNINNLLREKISSLEVGLANAHIEDKSDELLEQ